LYISFLPGDRVSPCPTNRLLQMVLGSEVSSPRWPQFRRSNRASTSTSLLLVSPSIIVWLPLVHGIQICVSLLQLLTLCYLLQAPGKEFTCFDPWHRKETTFLAASTTFPSLFGCLVRQSHMYGSSSRPV
jgi:hypothetical protein